MAQRGRYQAHAELITVLGGINGTGGGYWHNLGGRVYKRMVVPEEEGPIGLPYVCVPLEGDNPAVEHTEQGVILQWTEAISGFVAETSESDVDANSPDAALKLWDDIVRALLKTRTANGQWLNGKAENLEILSGGGTVAGVIGDDDYGEVLVLVQLQTRFDDKDLGPNA